VPGIAERPPSAPAVPLFSPGADRDPASPVPASARTLFVAADRLNLRSGPGPGNTVVATLPRGTRVDAFETQGSWRRVTVPGASGWVAARYLVETPPRTGNARSRPAATAAPKAPSPTLARPAPVRRAIETAPSACCKVCRKGKPCGNSCIARDRRCRKGPGCACAGGF